MKRILFLLMLLVTSAASAQGIRGRVLVSGTDEPAPNASIYYDGMYKGSISGQDGKFELIATASTKHRLCD